MKNRMNALKAIKGIFSPRQSMPIWDNYLVTPTHIERAGGIKKSPFIAAVKLFTPTTINQSVVLKEVESDAYLVDSNYACFGGVKTTYVSAEEYPDTFTGLVNDMSTITLRDYQWSRIVRISEAVAIDETRFTLSCVLLDSKGSAVGTDGHMLSFNDNVGSGTLSGDLLIPAQIIRALRKAVVHSIQRIGEEHGVLSGTLYGIPFEVTYRYESAKYPEWKAVLPKKSGHRLEVPVKPLSAALKQVIKRGTDKKPVVKIYFTDNGLHLEHKDPESSFDTVLPFNGSTYMGPPIAFNACYLLTAIDGSEKVTLDIHGELAPLLVHAEECTSIVMPIRY